MGGTGEVLARSYRAGRQKVQWQAKGSVSSAKAEHHYLPEKRATRHPVAKQLCPGEFCWCYQPLGSHPGTPLGEHTLLFYRTGGDGAI